MGWSTDLLCTISFSKETYNHKDEVESKISELDRCIESCKRTIRDMALMTEPSKFIDSNDNTDGSPYYFVTSQVEENLEALEEFIIERYKLCLLLENWEKCHNEKGLAIYPPDNIDWDSAYLSGDFVRSTKYPDDKSLI